MHQKPKTKNLDPQLSLSLMGTLFKYYQLLFCTFLFLFTVPTSSSSPHDQTRPKTQTHSSSTAQYQVLYIKNTAPFLLDEQDRHPRRLNKKRAVIGGGKRKNKKASTSTTTTKKFKNSGPFSVMLPKGFVPPSGSSPCHNGNPNSVVFFCDLAKP